MKKIIIYKYERAPGRTTVSPRKPLCEHIEMVRLIADKGKALTNDDGKTMLYCIDTESEDGWVEIDIPQELKK